MSGRAGRGRVRAVLRSARGSLHTPAGPHPRWAAGRLTGRGWPGAMMGR